ncbi:MAG: response regulator [Candidatus Heimdallarchaeota archaeon]|nr:response regulator [Candidatus Heimdallarchaeota archaeon]
MKVLIADDNSNNLYLLEMILKSQGHEVVSAENGSIAYDLLNSQSFDMIISDILMPVMDGFMLCARVKRDPKFKGLIFIFYTATYTTKEDERFCYLIGADRYIRKPTDPDLLIKEINETIKAFNEGKKSLNFAKLNDNESSLLHLYNERILFKLDQKVEALQNEIENRKRIEHRLIEAQSIANLGFWEYNLNEGV